MHFVPRVIHSFFRFILIYLISFLTILSRMSNSPQKQIKDILAIKHKKRLSALLLQALKIPRPLADGGF